MAERLANSLYSMMIISVVLSMLFIISGLIVSYFYDLTSGASIIMVSATALILSISVDSLIKRFKRGIAS